MFRGHTQVIMAVERRSRRISPADAVSPACDTSLISSSDSPSEVMPVMLRSPRIDEENGFVAFFANNFTCDNFRLGTNIFWIPTNFQDLLNCECLKFSVQATGAMALALLQRSPEHYRKAQKYYGLALLNLANRAREESAMDTDEILFTVLFLYFFESQASYSATSDQSDITHLHGLGTLLARRERKFLRSGVGARLFFRARIQAILEALRNKTPVPEMYSKPFPLSGMPLPPQLVQTDKADMLLIRLATTQSECHSPTPSFQVVRELISLADNFSQWMADLPDYWAPFHNDHACRSDRWWDTRCDIYPSLSIAHTWNKMRAARILTEDLIQEQLIHLSTLEGYEATSDTLQTRTEFYTPEIARLITDICAAIPSYYRPFDTAGDLHACKIPPPLGATYWLLWPIEVVGSTRNTPLEIIDWLLQCLERIYTTTGIIKAQVAADKIKAAHRSTVCCDVTATSIWLDQLP